MNPPPNPADLHLEEAAGVMEPDAPKHKRKPPKRKKKFGKYARGGDRKIASVAVSIAAANQDGRQAPATTSQPITKKKATKAELVKAVAYAKRESGKRKERCTALTKSLATQQAKLSDKAAECRKVAQLAQDRRREANLAREEANSRVAHGQSKARKVVWKERAIHHDLIVQKNVEMRELEERHVEMMVAAQTKHTVQLDKAAKREQIILATMQDGKMSHQVEVDNLQVVHRAKLVKVKAELRANSSAAISLLQKQIGKMETDHVGYIALYSSMVNEYNHQKLEVQLQKRELRMKGDKVARISATSCQRLIKIRQLHYDNNRHAARVVDQEFNMM